MLKAPTFEKDDQSFVVKPQSAGPQKLYGFVIIHVASSAGHQLRTRVRGDRLKWVARKSVERGIPALFCELPRAKISIEP